MEATSRASSKLLHGGLRYLENGEFRLVREALRERDAWLRRAPQLAWPIRIVMPIYRHARRSRWMVAAGLFAYDRIAGQTDQPRAKWQDAKQLTTRDPSLETSGLQGGYEFSDAQMDDYALGNWVASQAQVAGVTIREHTNVESLTKTGEIRIAEKTLTYDRIINVAGPWACELLDKSGISTPYKIETVRGSHLVIKRPIAQAYLLEVPGERRIFFALPWKGEALIGTTEVRQSLKEKIKCSMEERNYLLSAYKKYFPTALPVETGSFAGVRPLIYSQTDPNRMTREYAIHRQNNLICVFGGKWTTAHSLATRVAEIAISR